MVCSAPLQLGDALDANRGRARALDLRAHGSQECGQIGDFRLARRILDHGFAARQHGRHQKVFGASDRDAVELNVRALKTVGSLRFDIAVLLADFRAQSLQPGDVQIDRTRADGAPARQRYAGLTAPPDQRSQHQAGGSHGLDQFVGRLGMLDPAGTDRHPAAFRWRCRLPHGGSGRAWSRCPGPAESGLK